MDHQLVSNPLAFAQTRQARAFNRADLRLLTFHWFMTGAQCPEIDVIGSETLIPKATRALPIRRGLGAEEAATIPASERRCSDLWLRTAACHGPG